ncbi:hypothetical protein F4780DRAFT_780577 [Xylariomycetidae sp. FL0641]|nr:hypothetical protein F4780DRAFT_780577 [Xylariomycetidae sp. FL0641]
MKFTAAAVTFAAGASAAVQASSAPASSGKVSYTTEVVTAVTTFCPAATEIPWGTKTFTITEPTSLTITDCAGGCTVTKPVYTSSTVICNSCSSPSAPAPVASSSSAEVPPPVYPTTGFTNSTASVPTTPVAVPTSTGGVYPTGTPETSPIPTAGAGKVAAFSGAGLAAVLGFAVFAL